MAGEATRCGASSSATPLAGSATIGSTACGWTPFTRCSIESATHFLEELADEVAKLELETGRRLVLIAESDSNDPRLVRSRDLGGYGLHAQWSDDLHHSLHAWLTGETAGYYADFGTAKHVAEALGHAFLYRGQKSHFRGRRHGRAPDGLTADRFLGYSQTHDQVGNRALGERLSKLAGFDRAKVAAGLVLTAPFVPMLFQGEEWGATSPFLYFTDHTDPELGRQVSQGRRREFEAFGWPADSVPDPQSKETFERSRLHWEELEQEPHRSMLAWYQDLVRLRRERDDLRDPRFETLVVTSDERGFVRVERERTTIVASVAKTAIDVDVEVRPGEILLSSNPNAMLSDGRVRMPPSSLVVLEGGS